MDADKRRSSASAWQQRSSLRAAIGEKTPDFAPPASTDEPPLLRTWVPLAVRPRGCPNDGEGTRSGC